MILPTFGVAVPTTELICLDQFGYLANRPKVAIFARPVLGQNSDQTYEPGNAFEVRSAVDSQTVFNGTLSRWNDGKLSSLAGDKVWFADFSALKTPGKYYLFDPKNNVKSFSFSIGLNLYQPMLEAATKMLYYQRANTEIPRIYGLNWVHPVSHRGPGQDQEAQLFRDGKPQGMPKDLTGGWYDAGDLTKYIPYLRECLFNLLTAFELNPKAFSDSTNIPESGNGVPDLVDEMKWELDWTLKMQDADGGVFNRNGGISYDNGLGGVEGWASDKQPRYYSSKTTWATACAAAFWAKASFTFKKFDQQFPGYSEKLKAASLKAWDYLEEHSKMEPESGTDLAPEIVSSQASSNPNSDMGDRIWAAAELFRLTGEQRFSNFVDLNALAIDSTSVNKFHPLQGEEPICDPLNHEGLTQGLITYAQTKKATPLIVKLFRQSIFNMAEMIRTRTGGEDDPYLNYIYPAHYTWGSNSHRGTWGRILLTAIRLNVNPKMNVQYRDIMESYTHWNHGRNPLSWCFLSSMEKFGASKSVNSIYHHWFQSKSPFDKGIGPPPGFLVGGPNQYFSVKWLSPPYGEPPMKSFRNWNVAFNEERKENEASWEITEPAIYYNATYILLLSQQVSGK